MLAISNDIQPAKDILDKLAKYQKEINDLPTFEKRSEQAKISFSSQNRKGNKTFDAIKEKLREISPGIERCAYCEDSQCDEVEHIYPKDLYPQYCFEWSNYVYACGTCNGPKNNKFAVFRADNGEYQEVNPPKGKKAKEPPEGNAVFINPRVENPLVFCRLDLETFKFMIVAPINSNNYKRADYTFNEVLRLNDQREGLRKRRKKAFEDYKMRLEVYTNKKHQGCEQAKLDRMIANIKRSDHPTVWKEMQRQYCENLLKDNELVVLFQQSPEALSW